MPVLLNLLTFLSTAKKIKNVVEDIQSSDQTDESKKHAISVANFKAVKVASKESLFMGRKFRMAVLGVVLTFLNKQFNWGLDVAELSFALSPIIAFIVAQGIADRK